MSSKPIEQVIMVLMMSRADAKAMLNFHNASKDDNLKSIKDLEGLNWMGLGTDNTEPEVEILSIIELCVQAVTR